MLVAIKSAATAITTRPHRRILSKTSSLLAILFVARSSARAFSTGVNNNNLISHSTFGSSKTTHTWPSNTFLHTTRGGDISSSILSTRRFSTLTDTTSITTTTTTDTTTSEIMSPSQKLTALRTSMSTNAIDVYLIPSDDPHLSEYVPTAYMRRAFISGFMGSAGTAVVTGDKAYLWTDSRYFNEATLQLDATHWILMKQGQPKVPTITKFLSDLAISHYNDKNQPLKVGIDPFVHSASFAKELMDALGDAAKDLEVDDAANGDGSSDVPPIIAKLDTLDGMPNLIDSIWSNRPPLPTNPFVIQPLKYAGMSVSDKIIKIRSEMKEKKSTLSVFSALDDIAYLFNVRCMGDIETCPVGIAYATISHDSVTLYCDEEKVTEKDVMDHLKEASVMVQPYDNIVNAIKSHLDESKKNKVWLDSSRSNYALSRVVPTKQLIDAQNAVTAMKAVKNDAEMEGMRQAHIVDGAAMAYFMAWLEHAIIVEGREVSEVEVDEVLTGFRAKQPGFKEVSFPTIAGVGSNGAIVHYRAAEGSELLKKLDKTAPILIDSGGQYEYGTTDVTRTWYFGDEPAEEFKEMYTRVLKGNIGVDTMIFPENTPGFVLDVFARKALWEIGKDYGHGTGHGVGAALNVHEGPHGISPRWSNKEVLKAGMVTSNEPGFYDDGNFGIRIENLLEIVSVNGNDDEKSANGENGEPPAKKQKKAEGKQFLKFDRLTMIPIQKNLINLDIMTDSELDWVDTYHEEVLSKVKPLLNEGTPAMDWLVKSCEKIERK